jgi:hypothetical protein
MKKFAIKYLELKKWQQFLILLPISFIIFFGLATIANYHSFFVNLKISLITGFITSFIGSSRILDFQKKN